MDKQEIQERWSKGEELKFLFFMGIILNQY